MKTESHWLNHRIVDRKVRTEAPGVLELYFLISIALPTKGFKTAKPQNHEKKYVLAQRSLDNMIQQYFQCYITIRYKRVVHPPPKPQGDGLGHILCNPRRNYIHYHTNISMKTSHAFSSKLCINFPTQNNLVLRNLFVLFLIVAIRKGTQGRKCLFLSTVGEETVYCRGNTG